MEVFSSFYNYLKDRFSNTLIFTFIVSWCIWNWEIIIGLLWHEEFHLLNDGHVSYTHMIREISERNGLRKLLAYPLILSILYTFLISKLIEILLAKVNSITEDSIIKASKLNSVSIKKYLNLRKGYDQQEELLQSILRTESKTLSDYETVKSENTKLKTEIFNLNNSHQSNIDGHVRIIEDLRNDLEQSQQEYENFRHQLNSEAFGIDTIIGKWNKRNHNGEKKVTINTNPTTNQPKITYMQSEKSNEIIGFHFNSLTKKIFFVEKIDPNTNRVIELDQKNKSYLVGRENNFHVEFIRLDE